MLRGTIFISPFLKLLSGLLALTSGLCAQGVEGYYRYPTLSHDRLVFAAEGDLWTVPLTGGLARRLTTHLGEETHPQVSPDGKTLAFTASYEGPTEVYTMPLTGGLPQRWTYEADPSVCNGWTPQGEVVYTTRHFSTLPDLQIVTINPETNAVRRLPLAQGAEASFDKTGKTVFFVKPTDHRNVTKRYTGGTARQIWRYTEGDAEARRLTSDKEHRGENHHPMWWNGRVYFITDRDQTMNLWSMNDEGEDFQQHTSHRDFDVRQASLFDGKIVYHRAGDLHLYDIAAGEGRVVPIQLVSDLDQLREKWVTKPLDFATHQALHPEGEQVVITARGRVFVMPVKSGRPVTVSKAGVRYRNAVFSADGKDILALSDESSEFEFVRIPATGVGNSKALTSNGDVLRYDGSPSPDGKWLAFRDHRQDLWLLEIESGLQRKVSTNNHGVGAISWSPDSQWLAFEQTAANMFTQLLLHRTKDGKGITLTSDRANSTDPVWHPDGEWIYFLSDRNFETLVGSPWGPRQPEPYFDRKIKLYQVSLKKGVRSPFRPHDELHEKPVADEETGEKSEEDDSPEEQEPPPLEIEEDGIQRRIQEVPLKPGNYGSLQCNKEALYLTSRGTGLEAKTDILVLKIANDSPKPSTLVEDVRSFELSANGKKILIHKGSNLYVDNAGTAPLNKLDEHQVDLRNWSFSINVREDWRQIYTDAWRMERDYFYDPGMHGVDWQGMHEKYLPLVDRVTTRVELSDVIGRLIGELSALHTSVRGGDLRKGNDDVKVASLGGRLTLDEAGGGYRIDYIYRADPDYPHERSPLDHPEQDINVGDVILRINGVDTLSARSLGELLRNQAGKQVRLAVKKASGETTDVIVVPTSRAYQLRYDDWEYTRRLKVEEMAEGRIGYVHLQAMGASDLEQWYREFYPVFNRQGLIIDVRHNNGGNIESFILEKLMRKAWMYWKSREHDPEWNMQYAFRGHLVVLVDEHTASDGEAFADGFRRLELGKVIGMRTWGGEIWLSSRNRLSDGGLARAPSAGVYGPEGEWLIEQIGVIPDIEVDNLPHATFHGHDAQLEAAIQHLLEAIERDPRKVPAPPKFPDRSYQATP